MEFKESVPENAFEPRIKTNNDNEIAPLELIETEAYGFMIHCLSLHKKEPEKCREVDYWKMLYYRNIRGEL